MSPALRTLIEILLRLRRALAAVARIHLLNDERPVALDETVECEANTFTICSSHRSEFLWCGYAAKRGVQKRRSS